MTSHNDEIAVFDAFKIIFLIVILLISCKIGYNFGYNNVDADKYRNEAMFNFYSEAERRGYGTLTVNKNTNMYEFDWKKQQ